MPKPPFVFYKKNNLSFLKTNKQTLFSEKSSVLYIVVPRILLSERISTRIRAWLSCCLYYNPEVCTAVLETTSSAVFILG